MPGIVNKREKRLYFLLCWMKKQFLQYERKYSRKFVIFSEIMLDILIYPWYIIQARVGNTYARNAMMQEIASKDGNFCGVCPVIGRLNCFCKR